jgi:hypothetical protein
LQQFKQLYDGEIQLKVLSEIEPDVWNYEKVRTSHSPARRTSFTPSRRVADKKMGPVLSSSDKINYFRNIAQKAEVYF